MAAPTLDELIDRHAAACLAAGRRALDLAESLMERRDRGARNLDPEIARAEELADLYSAAALVAARDGRILMTPAHSSLPEYVSRPGGAIGQALSAGAVLYETPADLDVDPEAGRQKAEAIGRVREIVARHRSRQAEPEPAAYDEPDDFDDEGTDAGLGELDDDE